LELSPIAGSITSTSLPMVRLCQLNLSFLGQAGSQAVSPLQVKLVEDLGGMLGKLD
jgi:hypothetical protein